MDEAQTFADALIRCTDLYFENHIDSKVFQIMNRLLWEAVKNHNLLNEVEAIVQEHFMNTMKDALDRMEK